MRLFLLECVQLWRSWTIRFGFLCLVVAGVAALAHGSATIDRQRAAIAEGPALQDEQHRTIFDPIPSSAPAGDQLYYLYFYTAHEPSAWASFATGLRDAQPFNLRIRLLAIEGQLYDSELANPLIATLGPFDAALVLVLLAPLFVIALMHNVWSAEEEQGTARLIRSQPISRIRVMLTKIGARTVVAVAPFSIVTAAAIVWFGITFDGTALLVLLLITGYALAWIGLATIVAGLGRTSEFNLVALLGVWVALAVVGPALLSLASVVRHPTPEALELTVAQRQGYHAGWDAPLTETMANFYRTYPEWRDVPVPSDTYSNAWYYAMQQRGDDAARPASEAYRGALARRQAFVRRCAVLMPPALVQSALTAVARTDLASHLAYQQSVRAYHETLKRYFLPAIFLNTAIADVNWAGAPAFVMPSATDTSVPWRQTGWLWLQAVVFVTGGVIVLGRRVGGGA